MDIKINWNANVIHPTSHVRQNVVLVSSQSIASFICIRGRWVRWTDGQILAPISIERTEIVHHVRIWRERMMEPTGAAWNEPETINLQDNHIHDPECADLLRARLISSPFPPTHLLQKRWRRVSKQDDSLCDVLHRLGFPERRKRKENMESSCA